MDETQVPPETQTPPTEQQTEPPQAEPPKEIPQPKKKWLKLTRKQVVITVIVAGLCAIGGSVYAYKAVKKSQNSSTPGGSITIKDGASQQANLQKTKTEEKITVSQLSGNTYLAVPKKVGDLKFYKDLSYFGQDNCDNQGKNCTNTYTDADLGYYEIGQTSDKQKIYMAYAKSKTIDNGIQQLAIETSPQKYMLLMQPIWTYDNKPITSVDQALLESLNSNVTTNLNLVFAELSFPKEVVVGGQKIKSADYAYPVFMPEGIKSLCVGAYCAQAKPDQLIEKIGDANGYSFYRTYFKTEQNYQIIELDGVYANMFDVSYNLNGELSSTSDKLPITWSKGDTEAISAYSGGAGCGSVGYVIARDTAGLIQIGITKAGQKVYQLPATAALTKELYENDYKNGEGIAPENPSLANLTMQQFLDKHAFFLVQNSFNEYIVFQRLDMFVRGGCGKPVVYLYPTSPTNVSVKVGAHVVVSEPFYGQNGWQNVFATPSGALTYNGKSYDSLYWEGYGNGAYPEITEGTVVTGSQTASTIRAQLTAQGLSSKEIADFMKYWEPKLPHTPYVRLTWFGTGLMNQLAPLSISPTPQTVIRTFLDFEGLNSPISLKPQAFSKRARSGFTVVEWGGLLRNGIH